MNNFQPVTPAQHGQLKLKADIDWPFIASQHQLEVTVVEALQAASSFPLFFIEHQDTGVTSIAAITSFVLNTNVLANEKGEHQLAYVPLAASSRPFALGLDPDHDKQVIPFLDLNSQLIVEKDTDAESTAAKNNESVGSGQTSEKQKKPKIEALFDGEQATPYFQRINRQLEQFYHGQVETGKCLKALKELNVIHDVELELSLADGKKSRLTGLQHLNEKRLNALTDAEQKSLLDKGYFSVIYAMLVSLTQLNRLIHGHGKRGDPITGINVKPVKA